MTDLRTTTIIAWRARPELRDTLQHNAPFLHALGARVIVVNCGGDPAELRGLLSDDHRLHITQIDLPDRPFNKSFALNVGIHEAPAGVVFVLDADILLTASFASYADVCATRDCFIVASGMTSIPPRAPIFTFPPGSFLRKVVLVSSHAYHWADGTVTDVLRQRIDCESSHRVAPGIILARKDHLLDVGGYRSDLQGWGWEDLDIQIRLAHRGLECLYADEEIKHLDHGDEKRDLAGPKVDVEQANRARVWQSYCAGDLLGTYHADVRAWQAARAAAPDEQAPRCQPASQGVA